MLHWTTHVAINHQHALAHPSQGQRQCVKRERLALPLLRAGDQDGARQSGRRCQQERGSDRRKNFRWLGIVTRDGNGPQQRQSHPLGQRISGGDGIIEYVPRGDQQQSQQHAANGGEQQCQANARRKGFGRNGGAIKRLDASGLKACLRRHIAITLEQAVMQHPIGIDGPLINAQLHVASLRRLRLSFEIGDFRCKLGFAVDRDIIALLERCTDAIRHVLCLIVERRQTGARFPHFRVGVLAELPLFHQRGASLRAFCHQCLHRAIVEHFGQGLCTRTPRAFPGFLRCDAIGQRLGAKGVKLRQSGSDRAVGRQRIGACFRALPTSINRQFALRPRQITAGTIEFTQ